MLHTNATNGQLSSAQLTPAPPLLFNYLGRQELVGRVGKDNRQEENDQERRGVAAPVGREDEDGVLKQEEDAQGVNEEEAWLQG